MSTIFVVVMATYRRTLCWKKRNTVPNTGGVFAVGAIQQTMDITDVKRLRGYAPECGRSVVRAIRCASCRAGCSLVVPMRCFSVQDAGSYTCPERVLLLDSVTTVAPIGNSRSTSSRGGVVSVFRERF